MTFCRTLLHRLCTFSCPADRGCAETLGSLKSYLHSFQLVRGTWRAFQAFLWLCCFQDLGQVSDLTMVCCLTRAGQLFRQPELPVHLPLRPQLSMTRAAGCFSCQRNRISSAPNETTFPPAARTGTLTAWGWQGVVPDQEHQKLPLSLSEVQRLLTDKCFSTCCWHELYFRRPEVAVFDNLVQFIIVYRGEICSLPHSPYQNPASVLSYFFKSSLISSV